MSLYCGTASREGTTWPGFPGHVVTGAPGSMLALTGLETR